MIRNTRRPYDTRHSIRSPVVPVAAACRDLLHAGMQLVKFSQCPGHTLRANALTDQHVNQFTHHTQVPAKLRQSRVDVRVGPIRSHSSTVGGGPDDTPSFEGTTPDSSGRLGVDRVENAAGLAAHDRREVVVDALGVLLRRPRGGQGLAVAPARPSLL